MLNKTYKKLILLKKFERHGENENYIILRRNNFKQGTEMVDRSVCQDVAVQMQMLIRNDQLVKERSHR